MTTNAAFKRRIRDRMAKTGERYSAARRALVEQIPAGRRRTWASEPEHGDESIIAATGRSWDDWCDLIDASPVAGAGHTAIAAYVHEHEGGALTHWWSQAVTVGYERIVGIRVPYQRSDGTFAANRSRTVAIEPDALRALLLDEHGRATLFPDLETALRSKPGSTSIRIGLDPGVVLIDLAPASDGRTKVAVSHEQLPDLEATLEWRHWWAEWLDAIDGS